MGQCPVSLRGPTPLFFGSITHLWVQEHPMRVKGGCWHRSLPARPACLRAGVQEPGGRLDGTSAA